MRVAVGLDSMVLGEPQMSRLKMLVSKRVRPRAWVASWSVFSTHFAVAKQVRTETGIGKNPVSVYYAAVSMANRIFDDFSRANALLIGAGETIELVARHLHELVSVSSRGESCQERAEQVSSSLGGTAITLPEF